MADACWNMPDMHGIALCPTVYSDTVWRYVVILAADVNH